MIQDRTSVFPKAFIELTLGLSDVLKVTLFTFYPRGVGILPYKRLLGMCRWMGSHFHHWIDYNGVTFLVEVPEWDRTFSGFLG